MGVEPAVIVLALDTATPAVTAGLVRRDAGEQLLAQRVTVDPRAHAVAVVHDGVHHGQLPEGREIERLVKSADVGRGVAHLADHHVMLAFAFDRESSAGCQR